MLSLLLFPRMHLNLLSNIWHSGSSSRFYAWHHNLWSRNLGFLIGKISVLNVWNIFQVFLEVPSVLNSQFIHIIFIKYNSWNFHTPLLGILLDTYVLWKNGWFFFFFLEKRVFLNCFKFLVYNYSMSDCHFLLWVLSYSSEVTFWLLLSKYLFEL